MLCQAFDNAMGIPSGIAAPGPAALGELYQSNTAMLRRQGILLPPLTGAGRKRSRNENCWTYVGAKYEHREFIRKKAAKLNVTVEELEIREQLKEKERQRIKRKRLKEKKTAESAAILVPTTDVTVTIPIDGSSRNSGVDIGGIMGICGGGTVARSMRTLLT